MHHFRLLVMPMHRIGQHLHILYFFFQTPTIQLSLSLALT